MLADGDCIEGNSLLQLLRAQLHFTIKQLPIQLGHNTVLEAFDVVPGPYNHYILALDESASLMTLCYFQRDNIQTASCS